MSDRLVRIYIDESQRSGDSAPPHQIVKQLHENGVPTALALRGVAGFQAEGPVHMATLRHPRSPVQTVIVAMVREEQLAAVQALLDEILDDAIVELASVEPTPPAAAGAQTAPS